MQNKMQLLAKFKKILSIVTFGVQYRCKNLTLLSWSCYFRGRGLLLPELNGIYSHHCDLYTNREEHRLADHRQSPHRQSDRISPEMGKEEHQLHKIKTITISLPL